MNNNEVQLVEKPFFEGDITAKIKTLGEITSNIENVRNYANDLNDYYKNIIFSEESISLAKEEKKKVNKFKDEVSKYRKEIVTQFNEPIKKFEELAKETEKSLKETYDNINNQVKIYEDKQKEKIQQEIESYFNEYKVSHNLDFINFSDANINITLSASMKSLKQQAKDFIDKILDDIQLINTQEYKEEIMVEYKQSRNVSKSITTVKTRKEMLKRELEIQERQKEEAKILKQNLSAFESNEKLQSKEITVLEVPKKEFLAAKEVKLLSSTFTVKGTLEQLKALKEFIQVNGIEILPNKKSEKILTVNVIYDEDEYVGPIRQEISNEDQNIHFAVCNLSECPEDAIIGRDLFDADAYIRSLNKGIELAEKGFTKVSANYIKEDE